MEEMEAGEKTRPLQNLQDSMNQLGPIKKRRGRPPKYLNVWQQEHCASPASPATGEGRYDKENCGPRNVSPVSSPPSPTPQDPAATKLDTANTPYAPAPAPGPGLLVMARPPQPSLVGPQSTTAHVTAVMMDVNGNVQQVPAVSPPRSPDTPAITPTAATPHQPTKRRPGRPPGSTKRFKAATQAAPPHYAADKPPLQEDFTLRKFFEAGGRDYNDYLDWLKKKQTQVTSPLPVIPAPHFTPLMTAPASSLPYPCGSTPLPLPHLASLQQGAPGVLGPRSPAIGLTPTLYHLPGAPAVSMATAALRPDGPSLLPAFAPVQTSSPQPISAVGRSSPAQPPSPPSPPLNTDSGVLDLSAKSHKTRGSCSSLHQTSSEDSPMDASSVDSPISRHEDQTEETSTTGSDVTTTCHVTSDICQWGVEEVVGFVSSVPGCQEYAEAFREHRIDGTSLSHLSEEHLLNFVRMKLGPAIRLRLAVNHLQGQLSR